MIRSKKEKNKECIDLKDGSVVLRLDNIPTVVGDELFEAAIKENKIKVKELQYQAEGLKTKNYRALVIAAFIKRCARQEIKRCKGKK